MRIQHVAVARTSEAGSDRFFTGILGLARLREKRVDAAVGRALFGVDREHRAIDYGDEATRFEVFLVPLSARPAAGIGHVCLEVDDVEALAERCAAGGLEVRRAVRGERTVTFVADEDGNLYEIQARPAAR